MEDLMQRLELAALLDRYVASIDNGRLDEWTDLFTDDCLYEIMPRENEDQGLPAPLLRLDGKPMLRDRVLSLQHANIYAPPQYRHCLSGMQWRRQDERFHIGMSYVVVNTSQDGVSTVYQAGRYADVVIRTGQGLRFQSKRCIYDTLRVQTLLAFPI